MDSQIRQLLCQETRRRLLEESIPRILKCLDQLNEQEVWYRPNDQSNAVGNLILHLCGNVRQWLLSGLGKQKDIRQRQIEFDERGPMPKTQLVQQLEQLSNEVTVFLETLDLNELEKMHPVQGFQESGVAILVHVVEHFSYHTGQITYITKWLKDVDMGYYTGIDLGSRSQ